MCVNQAMFVQEELEARLSGSEYSLTDSELSVCALDWLQNAADMISGMLGESWVRQCRIFLKWWCEAGVQ